MINITRRSNRFFNDTLHGVVTRRPPREPPDLDMTPMIDITFLLLIFFLVASRPDTHAQARLPEARHGVGLAKPKCVIFTIAQSGLESAPVYFGNEKIEDHRLPSDLARQRSLIERYVLEGLDAGNRNVLIAADKGVAHREVARVAAAASRVEGIKLHFAVVDAD